MEITELNFENFVPEELVGMNVVNEYDILGRTRRVLSTIKSATKTQFKIKGGMTSFNIKTGNRKGGEPFSRPNFCRLISENSAIKIREGNKIANRKKELKTQITDELLYCNLSIEKLESILSEINNSHDNQRD